MLGVLTKPDRIPQGEEEEWLKFIKNSKEPLDNNWYCVKQPSSNDLKQNWTWQEAREKENAFFSTTAPWCELEPTYQKHLRTSNLVGRLSSVLSDLITKRYFHQCQFNSISSRLDCFLQSPRNSRRTRKVDLCHPRSTSATSTRTITTSDERSRQPTPRVCDRFGTTDRRCPQ